MPTLRFALVIALSNETRTSLNNIPELAAAIVIRVLSILSANLVVQIQARGDKIFASDDRRRINFIINFYNMAMFSNVLVRYCGIYE